MVIHRVLSPSSCSHSVLSRSRYLYLLLSQTIGCGGDGVSAIHQPVQHMSHYLLPGCSVGNSLKTEGKVDNLVGPCIHPNGSGARADHALKFSR